MFPFHYRVLQYLACYWGWYRQFVFVGIIIIIIIIIIIPYITPRFSSCHSCRFCCAHVQSKLEFASVPSDYVTLIPLRRTDVTENLSIYATTDFSLHLALKNEIKVISAYARCPVQC
jgi:hypothetical protein